MSDEELVGRIAALEVSQDEVEADGFEVEVAFRLQPGVDRKQVVAPSP
jgi:hypothetical protein